MKALIEYGWSILGIGFTEQEAWEDAQKNLPDELKAYHCEDLDDFESITDPLITNNFYFVEVPQKVDTYIWDNGYEGAYSYWQKLEEEAETWWL